MRFLDKSRSKCALWSHHEVVITAVILLQEIIQLSCLLSHPTLQLRRSPRVLPGKRISLKNFKTAVLLDACVVI